MLNPLLTVLSAAAAVVFIPLAHGHGVEVRQCLTPAGNMRFFVLHWHGALNAPSDAGTMQIQFDNLSAETSTVITTEADGMFNNKNIYSSSQATGWGCIDDATPTIVGSSCRSSEDDWVYFERSSTCNRPVRYTLLAGNTVYLMDGCSSPNLYNAVIPTFTATDASAPIPKIDGNTLPYSIVVTADNVGDSSKIVTFSATAEDDCDSSPTISFSQESGSAFPIGNTDVTVTATDSSGKSTSGTLTVTVIKKTEVPSSMVCAH